MTVTSNPFQPHFRVLSAILSEDKIDRAKLNASLIDWERHLLGDSAWQSLAFVPYIFRLLIVHELTECASSELLSHLKAISRTAALRSINRDLAMEKVTGAFSESQCRALLLKGAALDQYVYDRESFRQGVDIDLMVKESDFDQMEKILKDVATKVEAYPDRLAHADAAGQMTFVVDVPLPTYMDVHHQYAQEGIYPIDVDELFERSQPHPAHGLPFMVLSPEDNLIHFAIHGFKDQAFVHKQTVDTLLLIRKHEIDWPVVVDRARRNGALMPLIYLLEGMRRVFGFQVPGVVADELELKGFRRLVANRILGEGMPDDVRTGWAYRVRQLTLGWVLSGNLRGYLRQQLRFLGNLVRDRGA